MPCQHLLPFLPSLSSRALPLSLGAGGTVSTPSPSISAMPLPTPHKQAPEAQCDSSRPHSPSALRHPPVPRAPPSSPLAHQGEGGTRSNCAQGKRAEHGRNPSGKRPGGVHLHRCHCVHTTRAGPGTNGAASCARAEGVCTHSRSCANGWHIAAGVRRVRVGTETATERPRVRAKGAAMCELGQAHRGGELRGRAPVSAPPRRVDLDKFLYCRIS